MKCSSNVRGIRYCIIVELYCDCAGWLDLGANGGVGLRAIEIEDWARQIMERVDAGFKIEDSRVELKAEWPSDPNGAARRIAGLCNASAGAIGVLWVIGVDEVRGAQGVVAADLAAWWPAVCSEFLDGTPGVQDVVINYDGLEVVALLFSTDLAPYTVKVSEFGKTKGVKADREVPWREGTLVRTARRAELLRILLPTSVLPTLDARSSVVNAAVYPPQSSVSLTATTNFYAVLPMNSALVLANHQTEAWLDLPALGKRQSLDKVRLTAQIWRTTPSLQDARRHTVHQGDEQIILDGPGFFLAEAKFELSHDEWLSWIAEEAIDFGLTVRPAGSDLSVTTSVTLQHVRHAPDEDWGGGETLPHGWEWRAR